MLSQDVKRYHSSMYLGQILLSSFRSVRFTKRVASNIATQLFQQQQQFKPTMPPPHPLRRVSTGSLSALARSQDRSHTSPSGLDFLTPALTELADEAATLAANTAKLNELHDALGTFNEAFAGWLYALKMNAFCVEWPQVSITCLGSDELRIKGN